VFHARASWGGFNPAVSGAGGAAEIIALRWLGARPATVALGGSFHSQRLTLRASQVGTVAPARAARWDHARRLALAVSLCADPRLDVLFAPDISFEALPAAFARLADPVDRTLCQRVSYLRDV
jgi:hypothetical protein